ncbi:hypothetical protein [Amycolatopsis nigrescens]|uniref:hypothetical protein n=1 Tax=Amycolatopsis nigrescens TaxID=381445 RepID=UPI0012F7CCC5|nr:hypothetical protein [Amycolatopsis nigrescens]
MTPQTRELLAALAALNQKIPEVALSLLDGSLSTRRQHEFAELLAETSELLHQHARNRDAIPERPDD